jgi:hypothetical protein
VCVRDVLERQRVVEPPADIRTIPREPASVHGERAKDRPIPPDRRTGRRGLGSTTRSLAAAQRPCASSTGRRKLAQSRPRRCPAATECSQSHGSLPTRDRNNPPAAMDRDRQASARYCGAVLGKGPSSWDYEGAWKPGFAVSFDCVFVLHTISHRCQATVVPISSFLAHARANATASLPAHSSLQLSKNAT